MNLLKKLMIVCAVLSNVSSFAEKTHICSGAGMIEAVFDHVFLYTENVEDPDGNTGKQFKLVSIANNGETATAMMDTIEPNQEPLELGIWNEIYLNFVFDKKDMEINRENGSIIMKGHFISKQARDQVELNCKRI